MSFQSIKKNRSFNITLIALLSLAIGFYGLDAAFVNTGLGDEHMGDRSLPSGQIERFVGGYLEQYQIDSSHPEYQQIVYHLANQFKDNWRKTTQIAILLEKEGFEPNTQQIKSAIHGDTLTEADIERLASQNGLSAIQLISQASDEWRRIAFASLLKQSEIMDPYSIQVSKAIEGQTRVFKRYKLNLPAPSVTSQEIKQVYENNPANYQFPKTYALSTITLKGDQLITAPSVAKAQSYFKSHSSQKPVGKTIDLLLIKKKHPGALSQGDLHALTANEKSQITDLMRQGYEVYEQAHSFEVGLKKHDGHYTFKKILEPTQQALLLSYKQIMIEQALEKQKQDIKELAFTSQNLEPLAKHLNIKADRHQISSDEIDPSWPKADVLTYLNDSESLHYNSPILNTYNQSLLVLKLESITPEKQKTLSEATDEIKKALIHQKETHQNQQFSFNLMQELGNGPLSMDTKQQIIESRLSINYKDLKDYQFIEPILNAFYLYQTPSDQYPTFLINHSVAQLDSIRYPALSHIQDHQPPGYLAPSVGLFADLSA